MLRIHFKQSPRNNGRMSEALDRNDQSLFPVKTTATTEQIAWS